MNLPVAVIIDVTLNGNDGEQNNDDRKQCNCSFAFVAGERKMIANAHVRIVGRGKYVRRNLNLGR